jgi:hypothetical protein
MRISLSLFILLLLACCNNNNDVSQQEVKVDTGKAKPAPLPQKIYANARFKDVTIEKMQEYGEIKVKGKAQIFEASFNWVIEDGHNELKSGHEMTDAGAPEWGNFSFQIVPPKKENAKLHLILFEISAKDGSRQHELIIPLD